MHTLSRWADSAKTYKSILPLKTSFRPFAGTPTPALVKRHIEIYAKK